MTNPQNDKSFHQKNENEQVRELIYIYIKTRTSLEQKDKNIII